MAKRDEAAEAARRVVKTEERLRALQRDLEDFNRDVLGGRKERLAAVIEDVYQLTEKAGTVPGQISYSFDEVGAATRLALSFNVQGRYADIKKLLFSFESNPRFLLLENVALATDDVQPDVLRLNLTVAHYFRPDDSAAPHRVTRAARGTARAERRRPADPRRHPRPRAEFRNERAPESPEVESQAPSLRARGRPGSRGAVLPAEGIRGAPRAPWRRALPAARGRHEAPPTPSPCPT